VATLSGGDALERKLKEIADKIGKAGTLQVGFFEGATYPDGKPVPLIAFINEFGRTVKTKEGSFFQMPRPFFRNMIAKESPKWPAKLGRTAVASGYDMRLTLERMGAGIAGQLQASIRELTSPPLAPRTIARKGFSKPLIDTAVMINSVGYKVTAGDESSSGTGAQMSGAARAAMKGGS
jgi:hypothetical protein